MDGKSAVLNVFLIRVLIYTVCKQRSGRTEYHKTPRLLGAD